MKIINNITEKLLDDLKVGIMPQSKVSIAAACFSVYAYEELKKQLESVDELRFIFTSPTFLSESNSKEKRSSTFPVRHGKKRCMAVSLKSVCATSLRKRPSPKNALIGYAVKRNSNQTAPMRQCRVFLPSIANTQWRMLRSTASLGRIWVANGVATCSA